MKLIKPSVEIIPQSKGIDGVYKQIEKAGRTCYKSEDKITEDSAKKFVDMLTNHKHGAMLEHGTIYITIHWTYSKCDIFDDMVKFYTKNKYSRCKRVLINEDDLCPDLFITTNYRVIVENNRFSDLVYMCWATEHHDIRVTAKFTLDQGVMREFTRHRTFSFACESTRYCNYTKDKFGGEITFVRPSTLDREVLDSYGPYHTVTRNKSPESVFIASLNNSEKDYMDLIKLGWQPQQARAVLPLATKCELIMTGFIDDWKHFLSLRSSDYGATGAHPDASYLANMLYAKLREKNYIS